MQFVSDSLDISRKTTFVRQTEVIEIVCPAILNTTVAIHLANVRHGNLHVAKEHYMSFVDSCSCILEQYTSVQI